MKAELRKLLKDRVSRAGGRVEWLSLPQAGRLPAVALQLISARRTQTLEGPDGLVESIVQIDCWALTYTDCDALARQVVAALASIAPNAPPWRSALMVEAQRESWEADPAGGAGFFRTSLDVRAWHTEPQGD